MWNRGRDLAQSLRNFTRKGRSTRAVTSVSTLDSAGTANAVGEPSGADVDDTAAGSRSPVVASPQEDEEHVSHVDEPIGSVPDVAHPFVVSEHMDDEAEEDGQDEPRQVSASGIGFSVDEDMGPTRFDEEPLERHTFNVPMERNSYGAPVERNNVQRAAGHVSEALEEPLERDTFVALPVERNSYVAPMERNNVQRAAGHVSKAPEEPLERHTFNVPVERNSYVVPMERNNVQRAAGHVSEASEETAAVKPWGWGAPRLARGDWDERFAPLVPMPASWTELNGKTLPPVARPARYY